jgi:glycosyltransferase involved in cell wall biosynthesis
MPAYNEQENIRAAVADIQQHVLDAVPDSRLVVVDDGSRDATADILDDLASRDPRIHTIHQSNGGHGRALRTGLDAADAEYVFLLDSDRQIPLEPFSALWQAAQAGDGAFGVRRHRHDAHVRIWLTAFIRWMIRLLFGVRIHDANVPYKIFHRRLWVHARPCIPPNTLAPSLFLAVFARRHRYAIAEIDVLHRERQQGIVSVRRWKLLRFCSISLAQLVRFRSRCP